MTEPRNPLKKQRARETAGEGAPRRRKPNVTRSEQAADPQRGDEPTDAHAVDRKRDARDPEGM